MTDNIRLTGKKILVIEDDKFLGGLLSGKLTAASAEVTLVEKGEGAVEKAQEVMPNIIILDLLLPGMSGFDILKNIRQSAELRDTPVIILSNLSEESDIKQAKELGVTDFLIKATVNMNEIPARVAKILA